MSYRKFAGLVALVSGLSLSNPVQALTYFENFDGTSGFRISDAGFTGKFWQLDTAFGNKFMVSVPPGRSGQVSQATSPAFSLPVDREERGGFTVQYQLRYPGSGERDDASSFPVTTDVDLVDASGRPVFTLAFQRNAQSNVNRANLILTNHATGEVRAASTGSVTPLSSGTVNLRLMFLPAAQGASGIQVFYGENEEFRNTPLIADDYDGAIRVRRLVFRHKAGAHDSENQVRVDDVLVRPNDVIALPASPDNGFDKPLFASDGSNPATVFQAGDLYQGTFRLTRSIVPQAILFDCSLNYPRLRL